MQISTVFKDTVKKDLRSLYCCMRGEKNSACSGGNRKGMRK